MTASRAGAILPAVTAWTWLAWLWLLVRLLILAPLGFVTGFLLYVCAAALFHDVRPGDVVSFLVMACGAGAPTFLLARHTWRVWRDAVEYPAAKMSEELGTLLLLALLCAVPLTIVWPSFSDLVRRSAEGANKGNLAMLRADLAAYQAAHGRPPAGLDELGVGRVRPLRLWGYKAGTDHPTAEKWRLVENAASADSGEFAYRLGVSSTGAPAPHIFIDCTHTDSRGTSWTLY